jgi:hypothetical protein
MRGAQFYAAQLFQIIGMGVEASLLASVITNSVNLAFTFGAIGTVDRHAPHSQDPLLPSDTIL